MRTIKVTTKSSEQIAADFNAVFKAVKPDAATKPLTQADRLAPYRPYILKQRRRGLSWKQIADGMADPRINEKVTERLLKRLFGGAQKPAKSSTATTPARVSSDPRRQAVILDPLTGQPVTPPAA